jgi:hypothetical protein
MTYVNQWPNSRNSWAQNTCSKLPKYVIIFRKVSQIIQSVNKYTGTHVIGISVGALYLNICLCK